MHEKDTGKKTYALMQNVMVLHIALQYAAPSQGMEATTALVPGVSAVPFTEDLYRLTSPGMDIHVGSPFCTGGGKTTLSNQECTCSLYWNMVFMDPDVVHKSNSMRLSSYSLNKQSLLDVWAFISLNLMSML